MIPHQKFREAVFLSLYAIDNGSSLERELIQLIMEELKITKKGVYEGVAKAQKVVAALPEIDPEIKGLSKSYEFERIASVERSILRLALYEMVHEKDLPKKVAIAEAIRLSRKFSTPESSSFINAILDGFYKKHAPAS